MPAIPARPKTWANAEVLTHTDLNGEIDNIRDNVNAFGVYKDVSVTLTANYTFTPASGVGVTVSTGGIVVTGNSTITGTLGGLTGLTVASGGAAITGAVTLGTAASTIKGGATSLSLRNNADTQSWLTFTEATDAVTIANYTGAQALICNAAGAADAKIGLSSFAGNEAEGFLRLGVGGGTPTGVPGQGAVVLSDTGSQYKLFAFLNGAWRSTNLT
jgi:hypothetical protein